MKNKQQETIRTPDEEFEDWLILNFEPPTDEELSRLEKEVWGVSG